MIARRVTMRQIAVQAGVHSTTVSLALRNHPSLPAKTRERILALAKEMGYRPDPMLGALMHYRGLQHHTAVPPLIFYMNPWRTPKTWENESAHYDHCQGARKRAEELGFLFESCWLHAPGMNTIRWNQIIHTRNVRGVILGSFPHGRGHTRLALDGLSAVKIGGYYIEPKVHMIASNEVQCSQLAVRHAHKKGFRRIGLVVWKRTDEAAGRGWTSGYLGETSFYPKGLRVPPCVFAKWDERIFWKWFTHYNPEVILGFDHVLGWLRKRKVRVPEDVGFINLDLAKPDGNQAGVYQNHELAGAMATDILASLIQRNETGLPAWPLVTHLAGHWVDGETLPTRYSISQSDLEIESAESARPLLVALQ